MRSPRGEAKADLNDREKGEEGKGGEMEDVVTNEVRNKKRKRLWKEEWEKCVEWEERKK